MNSETKKEWLQIAYRLAKDVFFLYIAGGIGFLLAETVLPGIFSQRVNFFIFYSGFFVAMIGVISLGYLLRQDLGKAREKSEKRRGRRSIWMILFGIGIGILFFIPTARSVSMTILPFLGAGVAVVWVVLIENFFERTK